MPFFRDTLKRWKLERQGLSSGKKRKQNEEDSLINNIDESILVQIGVFLAYSLGMAFLTFNMGLLGILEDSTSKKVIEILFLVIALITVFVLNHREKLPKTRLLILIFGGLLLQTFLSCIVTVITDNFDLDGRYAILTTPYILIPMIHSALLGRWIGIFSAVYLAIFGCFLSPPELSTEVSVVSILSGLTAVYFTRSLKKRSQMLTAGVMAGVVAVIIVWGLGIIPIEESGDSKSAFYESLIIFGCCCFCGLVAGGILPAFEALFRITTKMTWLELSDLNHKLLRKMQLEAPGTFHHSMVVATLSEAAAEGISANAPLCRVASYFHDIGKIEKAEYFIENQGDENPHDNLTPNMSALVIIAHVKDGIDLAVRHKLNQSIINVIKEHHGKSLVYYFYRRALEAQDKALEEVKEGIRNEEDVPEVSEKGFRYPGPSPRTKERVIISLADSVESASRSLKKPTPQKIKTMIDEIVHNKIKAGHLDDCPLTFKELNSIKDTFSKTLRSMLHSRISYPKDEKEKNDSAETKKKVEPEESDS